MTMLTAALLFTIFVTNKVDGFLTATSSRTTTAVVGDAVSFSCRTNISGLALRWIYYTIRGGVMKYAWIHNGEELGRKFSGRFNVSLNPERTESILHIQTVHVNDFGMYNCSEANSSMIALTFRLDAVQEETTRRVASSVQHPTVETLLTDAPPGRHASAVHHHLFSTTMSDTTTRRDQGLLHSDQGSSTTNDTTYIIVGLMALLAFCLVVFAVMLIVILNKRRAEAHVIAGQNVEPNKVELCSVSDIDALFVPHTATLDYAPINHTDTETQTTLSPSAQRSSAGSSSPSHSYTQIVDNIEQANPVSRADDDDGYSRLDQLAVRDVIQRPPTVYSRLGGGLVNQR